MSTPTVGPWEPDPDREPGDLRRVYLDDDGTAASSGACTFVGGFCFVVWDRERSMLDEEHGMRDRESAQRAADAALVAHGEVLAK